MQEPHDPPPADPAPPAAPPPAEQQPGQQLADAAVAALRSVVSKPDVYLIKAAQASTLRQLKTARKLLRDFNTAAKVELEQQVAAGQVAVQQLLQLRTDLDEAYACIRSVKQQLAEHHPHLHSQLQQELAASAD